MRFFMRALPRCLGVVLSIVASGCGAHLQELSPTKSFADGDGDAIVVMRVTSKAWIQMARGNANEDGWRAPANTMGTQFWPEDGLIVARITPTVDDEALAIIGVRPEQCASTAEKPAQTRMTTVAWSPAKLVQAGAFVAAARKLMDCPYYDPKGGQRLPIINAVAGQVTYVGTLIIDDFADASSGNPIQKVAITPITPPDDIETVSRFMAKRYPEVRASVTPGIIRMVRRNEQTD